MADGFDAVDELYAGDQLWQLRSLGAKEGSPTRTQRRSADRAGSAQPGHDVPNDHHYQEELGGNPGAAPAATWAVSTVGDPGPIEFGNTSVAEAGWGWGVVAFG